MGGPSLSKVSFELENWVINEVILNEYPTFPCEVFNKKTHIERASHLPLLLQSCLCYETGAIHSGLEANDQRPLLSVDE